jgi:hypothetical protein
MPDRFAGAVTGVEDGAEPADSSLPPAPTRPSRPILIELAAAILIVGGVTGLLGLLGQLDRPTQTVDLFFAGSALLTIAVGLLVRIGRAWVFDINVVAIVLFLELTALPSAIAIAFATLDTVVLIALIRHRRWFDREED